MNGAILDDPFQTVEVLIVFLLHIEVGDRQVEDVLVKGRCEVGIEEVAIIESLACDAADEFEVLEVLEVDVALW